MNPILTVLRIAETGLCRIPIGGFKAILAGVGVSLLLSPSGIALAAEPAVMRIGIEPASAPLSFVKPDGSQGGFVVELIEAIAAEMKFKTRPTVTTWAELVTQFRAGEIDVLTNVAYSRERDEYMDFTVPHQIMPGTIFVRRGDRSLRTPADLALVRIAVVRESYSHAYLRARRLDQHLVFINSLEEALQALEDDRCDAVAATQIVGNYIIRQRGFARIVESEIALDDFSYRLHLSVRAGDSARLAILNEGLARIRANGTFDRIHEKWIGPLAARRLHAKDLKPVLLPFALVGLAVGGTLWWQRRLLRRLAEQAARLRENEERLQRVLAGSEDGFWDWDLVTGRIQRSERWASMLGYTLAEIEPTLESGTSLVHPDDRESYQAWKERLESRTNDRCDIEYRMLAKSGEWLWILDRGKVVSRASDGRPLRMSGTHTDITQRKQTEAALLESQRQLRRSAQLLRQTQTAARVGGWESDLRTGRVFWTPESYLMHETTPEEFQPTRESVFSFFTPASHKRLMVAVKAAIDEGTPYDLELEIVTARQRPLHVRVSGVPEKENDRVVKLYGSIRDITVERTTEQERENLRQKMIETQKLESLGVLAGGIAHDFNNLLTVILANTTFIRESHPRDHRLGQIENAAQRAAELCRQMLAYAGKGRFIVQQVDIAGFVRETHPLIRATISKKARMTLELEAVLPAVEADAAQLRQLVMNLVSNASEALGDAPGEIRIITRIARPEPTPGSIHHSFDLPPGDCVCLEITDTGHGMNAATLSRIFDPFFSTKFAGRGLGLAAVLGIVRAHHGALVVESAPARGTTFRVFLPAAKMMKPAQELGPGTAVTAHAPFKGGTVLIADDEPVVLETAAAILNNRGFTTVLAVDGDDALRKFRANPTGFDAVLLDLTMPGLDGAEVLRIIRSESPTIPALIMSGFSEQDVFDRLRGLGEVAILRKPFTQEMLLSRLSGITAR